MFSTKGSATTSTGGYLVDVPKAEKHRLSAGTFYFVSDLKNSSRFSTKELNSRNRSAREAEDKADERETRLLELMRCAIVAVGFFVLRLATRIT